MDGSHNGPGNQASVVAWDCDLGIQPWAFFWETGDLLPSEPLGLRQ